MYSIKSGVKINELNESDLKEYLDYKRDYFEKAADRESKSIDDLINHLWIANGAAATASISIIQNKGVTDSFQYWGACCFIFGLIALLIFKYLSEWIVSRDRFRFQYIINEISNRRINVDSIMNVRDRHQNIARLFLIALRLLAGSSFIVGLSMTLYSFRAFGFI